MLFLFEKNQKEMKERPLILVTNDDGITAPGIRALIEVMNEIGDVFVVAPDLSLIHISEPTRPY